MRLLNFTRHGKTEIDNFDLEEVISLVLESGVTSQFWIERQRDGVRISLPEGWECEIGNVTPQTGRRQLLLKEKEPID